MRNWKPTVRLLILLGLVAALVVPIARADGDPASDYLVVQSTFIPPDAAVPAAYTKQLNAAVEAARAGGYTVRVALIGTRYDMGAVTSLYEKPKQYVRFLGLELSLTYKQHLLIVMPNGLAVGIKGKPDGRGQAVVDRIRAPKARGAILASTATKAVVALARAAGVKIATPPLPKAGRTIPKNADQLASCLTHGLETTLERRGTELVVKWTSPVAKSNIGSTLFFIGVLNSSGHIEQFGVRYVGGVQNQFYIFDTATQKQRTLLRTAKRAGGSVEATFPLASTGIATRFHWYAKVNVGGTDVSACPRGGQAAMIPFPS
jgi:hypothetical protein